MNLFSLISHKKDKTKGFTLVELLVVISIISLLSSISMAALSNARKRARDAIRYNDVKQIQNAIELYSTANGHVPYLSNCGPDNPSNACLVYSDDTNGAAVAGWQSFGSALEPYIKKLPRDPIGMRNISSDPLPYRYVYYAPGYLQDMCNRAEPVCTVKSTDYAIYANRFEAQAGKFGFINPNPFGSY